LSVVLDASALLAFLHGEPGEDQVFACQRAAWRRRSRKLVRNPGSCVTEESVDLQTACRYAIHQDLDWNHWQPRMLRKVQWDRGRNCSNGWIAGPRASPTVTPASRSTNLPAC